MRLRSVSSLDWRATERPLSLRHSDSKSALGCARGSIDCLLFSLSAADAFVASQGWGVNIRKLDPTGPTIEYEHSIAAGNFTEEFGDIVLGPDRSPRPMFHRGGSPPVESSCARTRRSAFPSPRSRFLLTTVHQSCSKSGVTAQERIHARFRLVPRICEFRPTCSPAFVVSVLRARHHQGGYER